MKIDFLNYPAGSTLVLPAGVFDYDDDEIIFPDITIRGQGMGRTVLRGHRLVNAIPQFHLHNTTLQDLTLEIPMLPRDDCTLVGFASQPRGSTPYSARIQRCELACPGWCSYYWADDNATSEATMPSLSIEDCLVRHGRWGLTCGNSGYGMNLNVERTTFIGNAAWMWAGGSVSDPVWGGVAAILFRGGHLKVTDCVTCLTGGPGADSAHAWTPRLLSITDNNGEHGTIFPPAGTTRIEVNGLRSWLFANGSTFVYDLDVSFIKPENLVVSAGNCAGSAPDGGLTFSPGPAMP
jgi:hypothetical protein